MDTCDHYLTVVEAFSYDELISLIAGAKQYVETLIDWDIEISNEDIFAELYTDERLWHTKKVDPDRLKQNQRSYVLRGIIWRLRDYAISLQFDRHPLSLSEGTSIRRQLESRNGYAIRQELERQMNEEFEQPDSVGDEADAAHFADVDDFKHKIWKHTPMIWQIMVVAGFAEDDGIASTSLSDIKKAVRNKLAMAYEREGKTPPELSPSHVAQHLKLEVSKFCEITGRDFDQVWTATAVTLSSIRGTRGPYRKTRKKTN